MQALWWIDHYGRRLFDFETSTLSVYKMIKQGTPQEGSLKDFGLPQKYLTCSLKLTCVSFQFRCKASTEQ